MRKLSVIAGLVVFFWMQKLVLASHEKLIPHPGHKEMFSSKKGTQEIIKLLKQHVRVSEQQVEKAKKIYQSMTGDGIKDLTLKTDDLQFFFQDPLFIYPDPISNRYSGAAQFGLINNEITNFINNINRTERRHIFVYSSIMRRIINERLRYSGVVSKSVSLRALQDVEKRFIEIGKLLDKIKKTKDLKEVAELQARIKNMSSLIKNESIKLHGAVSLHDIEDKLIEIQKRKLYGRMFDSHFENMPNVRL